MWFCIWGLGRNLATDTIFISYHFELTGHKVNFKHLTVLYLYADIKGFFRQKNTQNSKEELTSIKSEQPLRFMERDALRELNSVIQAFHQLKPQ